MSKGRGKFTIQEAEKAGKDLGVKYETFTPEDLRIGMDVELEHGLGGSYNVTSDDTLQTARIAMAHLSERGDYYDRLEAVEGDALIITTRSLVHIALFVAAIIIVAYLLNLWFIAPKALNNITTSAPGVDPTASPSPTSV